MAEDNTFWIPDCNKCIHKKLCEYIHFYCDGICYEEQNSNISSEN